MSIKRSYTLPTIFLVSMILSGLLLSSSISYATDTNTSQDNVSVNVPVSCTMNGTGMTSHNANIPNGTYQADIGTTTLKTFCNDNQGFAIYAIGYTNEEYGNTNLVGLTQNQTIITGTATTTGNPDVSNWAVKLATNSGATYPLTLDNSFGSYHNVPTTYTKVAHRDSGTDLGSSATGASLTTTYAAYISKTQAADTYNGKVKYTLVHPSSEEPTQSITCDSGYICYYPNTSTYEGTMGKQEITSSSTSVQLIASNYSRSGYGFAGWSDSHDYKTNTNAHFYGPNETINFTAGDYTDSNPGLSLYAVWVKSAGSFQDSTIVSSLCSSTGSLTPVNYDSTAGALSADLTSVSALTDTRDNQTYAIAKLADGNCWMIENLRLADTHQESGNTVPTTLTMANTNNPLNDNDPSNPIVTLKHDYVDIVTYPTLSPTSDDWCTSNEHSCTRQSRLKTNNTSNRAVFSENDTMSAGSNLYSYGNYYNWYSATAGRATTDLAQTEGDLCPFGWRMPTGNKGSTANGSFSYLDKQMGGSGSDYSKNPISQLYMGIYWRSFPNNFIFTYNGSSGEYWSSTPWTGTSGVYTYKFDRYNYIYIGGTSSNREWWNGLPIRCLSKSNL